jgi:glycosyltransferase involved in cell wall biosynthesis
MRIAVCHPKPPFMTGGAESHAGGLVTALREAGHDAELVTIPFKWYPPSELVHQMGMWRSLDLTETNGEPIDMVIAQKFPAYMIRHPRKRIWLIHQHRTAYDLWDVPRVSDLIHEPDGVAVRDVIQAADPIGLGEAEKIFTNSQNVLGRLQRSTGLTGEVLYHRSPLADLLLRGEAGPQGDYILFPSRLDKLKRQHLAIDAMKHVASSVRLVLVGEGPQRAALEDQIRRGRLQDRVDLRARVSDEELIDLYLGALGVYFGPLDEDYGYITIEGMAAGRPVVVTTDAGGPLEFARGGETGIIVEPEPAAIGAAFDELFKDRASSDRMGAAGRAFVRGQIPDWSRVVRRLLADT